MTAVADLLSPADRERLAARLAELRGLDSAMRQPGSLAALPPATPLHKMADTTTTTTTTTRQDRHE